jgi:formiminotetrahydrofolate cyclodeaminase
LGVALLIKLARLTRLQDIPDHDRSLARLLTARDRLVALADADAAALTAWMHSRRLPANDPARRAALRALVDAPLEAAELCQTIAIEAEPLLEHGHPPALPDGQVGIQLLDACRRAQCSPCRSQFARSGRGRLDRSSARAPGTAFSRRAVTLESDRNSEG